MKLWSFKLTIQRHDKCLDEVNALTVPLVDRAGERGVRELILLYHGAIARAEEAEELSMRYARALEAAQSRPTLPEMGHRYPTSNVSTLPGPIERQALRETGYGLGITKAAPIYSAVDPMPVDEHNGQVTEGVSVAALNCPECGTRLSARTVTMLTRDTYDLYCEACDYVCHRVETPNDFYGALIPEPYENQYSTERLDGSQEMAFETHSKECPDCGSRMAMAPMREGQEPDTVGVECTGFPGSDQGCGYRKVLHREVRRESR
jgi:predicted RNA-binding Zn-ribbon protein involved in translation (DUF1610 family)